MRRIVGCCVIALVTSACVGSGREAVEGTSSTGVAPTVVGSTTTTTAPSVTTTTTPTATIAASTTTTTPTSACGSLPPLSATVTVTATVPVDADGDGLVDVMTTYLAEGRWRLRMEVGAGGGSDVALADVSPATGAVAIGGFDIEGDGSEELLVKVGAGAYATLVGLYDWDECGIVPIVLDTVDDTADGSPAVFAVGASVGNFSTMTCDGSMLWTSEGSLLAGSDMFEVRDVPYTLVGNVLTQGHGDGAAVSTDEIPPLFSCGDLTLP